MRRPFFVVIEVEVFLRRFFADLGCKGKQIGRLMFGSVQCFPEGPVFRPQVVVALLGARKLCLQPKEFTHDGFAL